MERITLKLLEEVSIGGRDHRLGALPEGMALREEIGRVTAAAVRGQVVHRARSDQGGLYETRAVKTPGGDALLMFPDGAMLHLFLPHRWHTALHLRVPEADLVAGLTP